MWQFYGLNVALSNGFNAMVPAVRQLDVARPLCQYCSPSEGFHLLRHPGCRLHGKMQVFSQVEAVHD